MKYWYAAKGTGVVKYVLCTRRENGSFVMIGLDHSAVLYGNLKEALAEELEELYLFVRSDPIIERSLN